MGVGQRRGTTVRSAMGHPQPNQALELTAPPAQALWCCVARLPGDRSSPRALGVRMDDARERTRRDEADEI